MKKKHKKNLKKSHSDWEVITLDLSPEEFCYIAELAHENDITFNQMANEMLLDYIEKNDNQEHLNG